jgi:hypothetical protein
MACKCRVAYDDAGLWGVKSCDSPTIRACSKCKRDTCEKHLGIGTQKCMDCYLKEDRDRAEASQNNGVLGGVSPLENRSK